MIVQHRPPQVQAVLVLIDVLALFGVVLDHHIFLIPEDILR